MRKFDNSARPNTFPQIPTDVLRADFSYHETLGRLFWACVRQGVRRGTQAGWIRYAGDSPHLRLNQLQYPVALLVWAMHKDEWPDALPQHIDGDRENCHIENLRVPALPEGINKYQLAHMRANSAANIHTSPKQAKPRQRPVVGARPEGKTTLDAVLPGILANYGPPPTT